MIDLKASALGLANYGWPIIALQPVSLGDKDSGKAPIVAGYPDRTETTVVEVNEWWSREPNANIGLVLGNQVGMWVLDVDPDKGGHLTLEALELEHGPLETVEVKTGSGGRHLYFQLPKDRVIRNRVNAGQGLDVRAQGGQVVLPPSMHFTGNRYEWKISPGDQDPAEAPRWLLDLVAPLTTPATKSKQGPVTTSAAPIPSNVKNPRLYARVALRNAAEEMRNAAPGTRNHTLNRVAFGMRELINRGWISRDEVEDALREAAESHPDSKLTIKPQSLEKTLASGLGDAYVAELVSEGPVAASSESPTATTAFDPNSIENPAAYALGALSQAVKDLTADNIQTQAEGLVKFVELGWIPRKKVEEALFRAGEATKVAARDVRTAISAGLGDASAPVSGVEVIDSGNFVQPEPEFWAAKVLDEVFTDDEQRMTLALWRDSWWRWVKELGAYREVEMKIMRRVIGQILHRLYVPGKDGPTRLVRTMKKVSETLDALPDICRVATTEEAPPFFFDGRDHDPYRLVPVSNGLLDLETGQLEPPTPELFTVNSLPVPWVPNAQPRAWLKFLRSLWPGTQGEESIRCLQQWFGYLLTPDTSQQKILLMYGPPRSGKGAILRVLRQLLGKNMGSSGPKAISGSFGLQGFDTKLAVAMPDARFPKDIEKQSEIVEILLKISGEDLVYVNVKNKPARNMRVPARIIITSNSIPRLAESSGALAHRFVCLHTEKSYLGQEDLTLDAKLEAELPAILQWAVQGWRDLRECEHLAATSDSERVVEEVRLIASPVAEFLAEQCVLEKEAWCDPEDLYEAYSGWCAKAGIRTPLRQRLLLREIQAQEASVRTTQNRRKASDGRRFKPWLGIRRKGPFELEDQA